MSKHLPAVIINDSPEKSVFIYYDLNALLNQTDVSLEPHESHIIEFDSTSLSVVMVFAPASLTCLGLGFPIMEGDTVRISYDKTKDTYNFAGSHQVELDLFKKIGLSDHSLGGFGHRITYGKLMPFDYFIKNWTAHKGEGERLINKLLSEKKVRPEISDFFKRELRIRMFNVLLNPVFAQKPDEPIREFSHMYKDTVKMQADILKQEIPLTSSRLLPYALRNYAWYILLSRGQHLTYPLLYQAAKEEYHGLQRDRALYFIIKEADRENYKIGDLLSDFQTITSNHHSFFQQELLAMDRKNYLDIFGDSLTNDSLIDRSGSVAKLHDVIKENKGKIIFIDIWASWCAPCLLELPKSAQLQNEFVREDFTVLFLSVDENKEKWKEALNLLIPEAINNYRFIGNRKNGLFDRFDIQGIPRYLILDREGSLHYSHAPSPSSERLKEILYDLFKK